MEVWKLIEGFENYEISNLGRVKSLKRISFHKRYGSFITKEKILKQTMNPWGYLIVCLTKNNKQKTVIVSRIVAIAFISNIENKPQVNHINGIKTDNRIENLEWNTSLENNIHALKLGLKIGVRGEKNHLSKLTEKEVVEIKNSNLTHRFLGKKFGVAHSTIGSIKRKETWNYEK